MLERKKQILIKSYSIKHNLKVSYFLVDHKIRKESSLEAKLVKKILNKKTLFSYGQNGTLLMSHASHHVPGVKFSTGSLGHGLPVAVGSALAAKLEKKNRKVYVLISDGELLYLYDPDLKQVVISQLKKIGGVSPAMLLVTKDIESLFNAIFVENRNRVSQYAQRLTPPKILINNLDAKVKLLETKFINYLENIVSKKNDEFDNFICKDPLGTIFVDFLPGDRPGGSVYLCRFN